MAGIYKTPEEMKAGRQEQKEAINQFVGGFKKGDQASGYAQAVQQQRGGFMGVGAGAVTPTPPVIQPAGGGASVPTTQITGQSDPFNLASNDLAKSMAEKEVSDIKEAGYKAEQERYNAMPKQTFGVGSDTGKYENVDMKTGNITLYGEKPQPYKGLSAESQQLIKEMDEQGISPGRRAEVIKGLIASEKGEAGAMERAKLGVGMTDYQKAQTELEREKMAQSAQQFAANKDMKNVENQRDFLMKFGGYTENEVLDVEGNKTTVRTPNMDILKEAFDDDGNINVQKALKGVEDNRSLQNAKAYLTKETASVIRQRLLDANVPQKKIDQLFKEKGL